MSKKNKIIVYRVINTDGKCWWTLKKPDNYYEREDKRLTLEAFSKLEIAGVHYKNIIKELCQII